MQFNYPIIDIHTHLRNDIPKHTKIAKESGIDVVVYMANCIPPLDNLERIKQSLETERHCKAIPVSAITKNLEGKELVDIDEIKPFVVGFSDDGKYLEDLNLLQEILKKEVLVMAHCSPPYEEGIKNPGLETEFIKRYLSILEKIGGKLHIQHISKKESVDLIREAKQRGIKITCETCPHYFTHTYQDLDVKVNPPLALKEDILAIKEGLSDGTIDVIASDYAPEPRETGIAEFKSFVLFSYELVQERVLTEEQLKDKLYINPEKVIKSGGYKLNLGSKPQSSISQ
jgi:dihydroorotase